MRTASGTRSLAGATVEVLLAVAIATGCVAALQSAAPPAGLGVLYLLAVLDVAIRRGEVPALVTALLSLLTLNFFFITPRYRLSIAHSQDVAELVVFLIAAGVVGRLAARGRLRAAEAERRAHEAAAREREASLLAEAAAAILASAGLVTQLEMIGRRVAAATGASGARVTLDEAPAAHGDELSVHLESRERPAWLYVNRDLTWDPQDVERLSEPLGRLIDVALERERVAEQAAETEAARRADIARKAVLHAISHDLRSPLTAITAAGSALKTPSLSPAERMELLDAIDTEAGRLARLVDDLLDLSRIEAGALMPVEDWCDLHDVVASGAAHVHDGSPIELLLPAELPLLRADAVQLERAFSNLIENAVKFSPPGSPVRITARLDSERVIVYIADQGPGISAQDQEHVFEPFFRGRGPGRAGSGLGLAIVKGFVEGNGGLVSVRSRAGSGTTFEISFPLAPQPVPLA